MSRANLQNNNSASIFLNESLANGNETTTNLNYCILIGSHAHNGYVLPVFNRSLVGETEMQLEKQADHFSIGNKQEKIYENLLNTKYLLKTTPNKDRLEAHHSTTTMVSAGSRAEVNPLLDPYIDAVQVRHRVSNKRGARVEAAAAAVLTAATTGDHEPKSSFHSKTVHIEEHKEVNDEWDYSSGDSDSDDDDDDEHKQQHHHHHAAGKYDKKHGHQKKHGHYKLNRRKRPKRRRPKQKVYNKVKVYKPKKERKGKKTIYVKHKEPMKHHDKHHYYDKGKYHHHQDEHYVNYEAGKGKHYDDHHHEHHYHKSKGKLVHLDLMNKGKMSLAGVLGYTLLCVNYLLVLKEPTYDKYSGHYYTRYKPHGGHGDTVEVKTGGPVILAHCGELPEPKDLVHIKRNPSDKIEVQTEKESSTAAPPVESTAANVPLGQNGTQTQATGSNKTKIMPAEQRRNVVRLSEYEQRPPLYYYTLSPPSTSPQNDLSSYGLRSQNSIGDQQQQLNRDLASPIQMALNRLFSMSAFGGANNLNDFDDDDNGGAQINAGPGVQVVTRPSGGPTRPTNGLTQQQQLLTANNGGQSGALIATGRRVVALVQQPQVVQTRDNLLDLRTRQIDIGLRIAGGRRFGLAQRTLSLTRNNRLEIDSERNQDVGGDDGSENAGPQASRANISSPARQQQQVLESPEYALAGDSIELTCNHRMPVDRLSAVRWFRDSLEFYRFVPTEEPRSSKTAFLVPEIDLDLGRSGSQSVFLRNVTHRASGQYRCQVVTANAGFSQDLQLMSGERVLRVYSLPDSGPQLMLTDDLPNQQLQVVALTNGQARRPIFLGEREGDWNQGVDEGIDNNNNNLNLPLGRQQRQQQQQQESSQIVRCMSARSNPVAQLRFFVNNRPIELARTLENSTLSYSDGLESNVVSFRLELRDFLATESNSLDRAATLKSKADNSEASTTTTTTSTTTTTTTTTARPRPTANRKLSDVGEPKVSRKKKKDKEKKKKNSSNRENPNANIRFDDQHEEQQAPKKSDMTTKSKQTKPKAIPSSNSPRGRVRNNNNNGPSTARMNSPSGSSIDDDASQVIAKIGQNFPFKTQRDLFGRNETRTMRRRDIFADLVRQLNSVTGDDDDDEKDKLKLVGSASGRKASKANSDNSQLVSKEQVGTRTISSTGLGLRPRNENNQQRQQQELVYSNFIRIRCSSLVPTLGYEMISELNVPLTLLVPAGQLNDAQSQLLNANNQRRDRDLSRRNDEVAEDDGSSARNRSGGSLQEPRTVSIDRVAQASGVQITTTATTELPSVRATNRATRFLHEAKNGASSRTTINCDPGAIWWALIMLLCCYKAQIQSCLSVHST